MTALAQHEGERAVVVELLGFLGRRGREWGGLSVVVRQCPHNVKGTELELVFEVVAQIPVAVLAGCDA